MVNLTCKSIVIFSYARADLLRDCIQSVLNAKDSKSWKKVLIWQEEYNDVYQVVEEFRPFFDFVIITKPQQLTVLGNINQNRVVGTTLCFDILGSEYVLGIEEDSMIGFDSLIFIDEMVKKFHSVKAFRGVNLGSLEKIETTSIGDYSLIRFGLHGQAGVLTRDTWKKIKIKKLLQNISVEGWDSRIEFITKSGFMVTPNASRLLDRGWIGTHAPTDSEHPYFKSMEASWVGTNEYEIPVYRQRNVIHSWRVDAVPYRRRDSLAFLIRRSLIGYAFYKYWRFLKLPRLRFENRKS